MSEEQSATPPKPPKPKSRNNRWFDAVADAVNAITELEAACDKLEAAVEEVRSVQEEYEEWKDSLPENLQSSAVAEKLETVCDLDIGDAASGVRGAIDEASRIIGEAESADLPLGFGRD